mmetsp:Transcript_18002/g.34343  ORF Transcript_18002/g.34343 Transcript_18002/m.34343 type:complete len:92 (-) Transcript_18002:186-461(-)
MIDHIASSRPLHHPSRTNVRLRGNANPLTMDRSQKTPGASALHRQVNAITTCEETSREAGKYQNKVKCHNTCRRIPFAALGAQQGNRYTPK